VANSLLGVLEIVTRTDPGLVRGQNEDAVVADANQGLAVLADGMGGYNAGEVASSMATKLLHAGLAAALQGTPGHQRDRRTGLPFAWRCLVEQIAAANAAIYRASETQSQLGGMGTTLVAVVFCDNTMIVAHVGDSRLYRLRGSKFVAMTRDHSLLQEQIDSGLISVEDARYAANRNLVTRAVGVDPEVEPEVHIHDVRPGDVYLLCSDGLYDLVDEREMQRTLERHDDLDNAAQHLIEMANDLGGDDNISVIVIKVLRRFPAAGGVWERLRSWFK